MVEAQLRRENARGFTPVRHTRNGTAHLLSKLAVRSIER